MNENLFEYSDMLRSPIEAFCCGTGYWEGPVSSHWHYFLELVYVQEGSVTVSCNDNTCLLKKGVFILLRIKSMRYKHTGKTFHIPQPRPHRPGAV